MQHLFFVCTVVQICPTEQKLIPTPLTATASEKNHTTALTKVIVLDMKVKYINAPSHPLLTVFQGLGDNLLGGGSCARSVCSLDDHAVLRELLQVVQHDALRGVSGRVHADYGELVIPSRTVLPVANLEAADHAVLQMLLGRLKKEDNDKNIKINRLGKNLLIVFYSVQLYQT